MLGAQWNKFHFKFILHIVRTRLQHVGHSRALVLARVYARQPDDERSMHLSISEMFSKPLENYFVNTTHKSVEKLFLWRNRNKMKFTKKRPRWSWKFVILVLGGLNLDSQWKFLMNMTFFTCERVDEKFCSPSHLQSSSRAPCSGRSNKRFVVMTGKSDSVCNTICLCRAIEYMQIVRNWESTCKLSSLPSQLDEASARSSATLKNVYLIENSNINKSLPKKTQWRWKV